MSKKQPTIRVVKNLPKGWVFWMSAVQCLDTAKDYARALSISDGLKTAVFEHEINCRFGTFQVIIKRARP